MVTRRCGIQPLYNKSGNALYQALWSVWKRMGMPQHLQVDNEFAFYGSPSHPRGMGPLIRLCLHHQIGLWFIPPAEPWRNGVVEQFNRHYQQKFLGRVIMNSREELEHQALCYEYKHNNSYRYSALAGKTPLGSLHQWKNHQLDFPTDEPAPTMPLKKPQTGRYHLIRLIQGDGKLDIFGEKFTMPPELHYEYVVATVDVEQQRLKVFQDQKQVLDFAYTMH